MKHSDQARRGGGREGGREREEEGCGSDRIEGEGARGLQIFCFAAKTPGGGGAQSLISLDQT